MLVSKASIVRLFASSDNHYNSILNTEVQKQYETEIKKQQTNVVDSMALSIHFNTFSQ